MRVGGWDLGYGRNLWGCGGLEKAGSEAGCSLPRVAIGMCACRVPSLLTRGFTPNIRNPWRPFESAHLQGSVPE